MAAILVGIVPTSDRTPREVLYGSRQTSYRYEVLTHSHVTGTDGLAGILDGVEGGSLSWSAFQAVKGGGNLTVADLEEAAPGTQRIGDVDLVTQRLRPVLEIEGLPEIPLGVYLITAAPESWSSTGRKFGLELHDRTTVLDQDAVDETFVADSATPILTIVQAVIVSAGEAIDVDGTELRTLSTPVIWPAGTSKLRIVNDLLDALGYGSLWVDGTGQFRATPYERPAARSIRYELLTGLDRDLVDGEESIYAPDWSRDRDSFRVPNKVIAVGTGDQDAPPPSAFAVNAAPGPLRADGTPNPLWEFSTVRLGRTRTSVLQGVEIPDFSAAPDPALALANFLANKAANSLLASSAVQATVQVKHLPVPAKLGDAFRFRSTPAGIDARHTVTGLALDLSPTGLMTSTLQEVIDL